MLARILCGMGNVALAQMKRPASSALAAGDYVAAYSGILAEPRVYCPRVPEHAPVERRNQYRSK
jgi:hypothetical protein